MSEEPHTAASKQRYRGGRDRFKKAIDALEQLESLEKAQAKMRKLKKGQRIERTNKSKQRLRNINRNLSQLEEFADEYR